MNAMPSLPIYDHYIDGAFRKPESGRYFETENPATGVAWARVAAGNTADISYAVASAKACLEGSTWREMKPTERGKLLVQLAEIIEREAPRIAAIEMQDNGKLASEVTSQVRYTAEYYRYYGGLADKVQGSVLPTDKKGVFAYTQHEPKGVVGIITPWNSPLTLTTWKLAPALAAGCTAVIKPSEFTSASVLEFVRLFEEAGFPPGVVNVVAGLGAEAGEALVDHPDVAHVGFTGGEAAGVKVYEAAARGLKSVTLELGGKSPNIVFDDADLDQAVKGAISGIFAAAGQQCVAGSRLLVQEAVHDAFVEKLVTYMRKARIGDPSEPETNIGPVATRPQFEKVLRYIELGRSEGATCVLGGKPVTGLGSGLYVEPTIFTGVRNEMRIAQEEIFGPVLSIIPFATEQDAVRIGNDIVYGLAAGVWTKSLHRARFMADRLKAGTIWINNYRATSFTSPFGGYKRSGIGRESGIDAIREYLETKCVWISTDLDVPDPFVRR